MNELGVFYDKGKAMSVPIQKIQIWQWWIENNSRFWYFFSFDVIIQGWAVMREYNISYL